MWIPLVAAAWAGLCTAPTPGSTRVDLLLCEGDGCSDRIFWATNEPLLKADDLMVLDSVLAESTASVAQGLELAERFRDGLEKARTALIEGKWSTADRALDDAGQALDGWQGTPTNAELYAYWFMRGAASEGAAAGSGTVDFQHAAAAAWNRSVATPEGLSAYEDAYYHALRGLLESMPGTVVVDTATPDTTYALDGVPIGAGPFRVDVLPGRHRLNASQTTLSLEWRSDVTVQAHRTVTARARFAGGDDPDQAARALEEAVATRHLDPDLADLLAEWARRHGLRTLRFLRLDAIPRANGPMYALTAVDYDPQLRRFSAVQ